MNFSFKTVFKVSPHSVDDLRIIQSHLVLTVSAKPDSHIQTHSQRDDGYEAGLGDLSINHFLPFLRWPVTAGACHQSTGSKQCFSRVTAAASSMFSVQQFELQITKTFSQCTILPLNRSFIFKRIVHPEIKLVIMYSPL